MKKAGGDPGTGVPARVPSEGWGGEGPSSSPAGSFSGRYRRMTRSAGMEASSALRAGVKTASGKKPAVVHTVTNRSRIRSRVWGRWRRVT